MGELSTTIKGIVLALAVAFSNTADVIFTNISTGYLSFREVTVIAGVIALPCSFILHLRNGTQLPTNGRDACLLLCAGVFMGLGHLLENHGVTMATSGDVIALQGTELVFCGIFSRVFLKESFGMSEILLCIFTLIGQQLILRPPYFVHLLGISGNLDDSDIATWSSFYGGLYAIASAASITAAYLSIRKLAEKKEYFSLIFFVTAVFQVSLPAVMCTWYIEWTMPTTAYVLTVTILAGFLSAVAIVCTLEALSFDSVLIANVVFNLDIPITYVIENYVTKAPHLQSHYWLSWIGGSILAVSAIVYVIVKHYSTSQEKSQWNQRRQGYVDISKK